MIRLALKKLIDMFPESYVKTVNGKEQSFLSQTENELSLFKKMAAVGDVFAISDEIDAFLDQLSLFSSQQQTSILAEKLLCQGFDLIQGETRGMGGQPLTINSSKLTILGASSGQRYATTLQQIDMNIGEYSVEHRTSLFCSHVIVCLSAIIGHHPALPRLNIVLMPTLPLSTKNPISFPRPVPTILHCLIIVHLLALEPIEFRFRNDAIDSFIGNAGFHSVHHSIDRDRREKKNLTLTL